MHITDSEADYLLVLLLDRIQYLEAQFRIAVTSQEEQEIHAELERARSVFSSLRR